MSLKPKGNTSAAAQSLGNQQFEHKWEQADDTQRTQRTCGIVINMTRKCMCKLEHPYMDVL